MERQDARRALLAGLIDHAPTFPPASLAPEQALAEDARALASQHSWVLARLVWRLSQFEALTSSGRAVSVVLDAAGASGVFRPVEAVEAQYRDDLAALRYTGEVYVEVPVDADLDDRLDELAARGFRAKVRCGGAVVPSVDDLARFVRACRERGLVFKATAGLHHAVRANGEHGFLNLLAAVAFAGDEESALVEADPSAFALDASAFTWRGRRAGPREVTRARSELLHSIGSCSFFEPIEELEALEMLAA